MATIHTAMLFTVGKSSLRLTGSIHVTFSMSAIPLANEGISDQLREAFIVYLLSNNRPMFEVLSVRPKDITSEFPRGFDGMTVQPVPLDESLAVHDALKNEIVEKMPAEHRQFLVSVERGEPDWPLLGVPGAQDLPVILWRQRNLATLDEAKRADLVRRLEKVLQT